MKYTDTNKPLVCMQTQSTCYKETPTMTIKGVLWHSTGANNPELRRYVQPSDTKPAEDTYSRDKWLELLGKNSNGNDWNHVANDVGMNCWVGQLADGTVTTVQTMPWNYVPWGVASGVENPCNNGWIQFEICEDGLSDTSYFNKIYAEACEITAYLCKMYNINPKGTVNVDGQQVPTILCHYDAYTYGLGSGHSDVYHWFNLHGKTMDNVRSDVASLLSGANFTLTPENSSSGTTVDPTVPIKPLESVLIKKISVTNESYDNVGIRLDTSETFSNYTWSYIITNLYTGKPSAEKLFDVLNKKTNFTIKGLTPNNSYLLEIIAKDSNKNKTSVPGFLFNTRQDFPREVTEVNFKVTGNSLSEMKCEISFTHPEFWGFFNEGIIKKGYRASLIVNGHEKGYSDSLFNVGSTFKSITLSELLTQLNIDKVSYNDIIQISIIPWIVDKQKNYVFAKAQAKSSQPVCLEYPSNINILHKLFLKTSNGFKQISLFNLSD